MKLKNLRLKNLALVEKQSEANKIPTSNLTNTVKSKTGFNCHAPALKSLLKVTPSGIENTSMLSDEVSAIMPSAPLTL